MSKTLCQQASEGTDMTKHSTSLVISFTQVQDYGYFNAIQINPLKRSIKITTNSVNE